MKGIASARFIPPLAGVLFVAVAGAAILQTDPFTRYLFAIRVPLQAYLFLIALPLLATTLLKPLFGGLYALAKPIELFAAAFSCLIASTVIWLAFQIIHGNIGRFGLAAPPVWTTQGLNIGLSMAVALAAGLLNILVASKSSEISTRGIVVGVSGGIVLWAGVVAVVVLLVNVVEPLAINWLGSFTVDEESFRGYLRRAPGDERPQVAPEHLLTLSLVLLMVPIYYLFTRRLSPINTYKLPALTYLMLATTNVTLVLSGMTFFFDKYDVPVSLFLLTLWGLGYLIFGIRHEFHVVEHPGARAAVPWDRLRSPKDRPGEIGGAASEMISACLGALAKKFVPGRPMVIVTASGGGIQAAAWTTQVLTKLEEELGRDFAESIALISSVSGGSVGSLYYLDRFAAQQSDEDNRARLEAIRLASQEDSLSHVGWGFAFPDFLRLLFLGRFVRVWNPTAKPSDPNAFPESWAPKNADGAYQAVDRGWAIEKSWQRHMANRHVRFSDWRSEIERGRLPVPVFNTTFVQTGERFLLCPVYTHKPADGSQFAGVFPPGAFDVDAVTAARLSASFPYVSPITRSDLDPGVGEPEEWLHHIADGGYFDNFGVYTALEWLDAFLEFEQERAPRPPDPKRPVFFVQINAFPARKSESPPSLLGRIVRRLEPWKQSLIGPIVAVVNVRTSTQRSRNQTELDMFGAKWAAAIDLHAIDVRFEFPKGREKERAPLSWRLTGRQKEFIRLSWNEFATLSSRYRRLKDAWAAADRA